MGKLYRPVNYILIAVVLALVLVTVFAWIMSGSSGRWTD
jgi:Flp pilus assembly pilin Flp